MKVFKITDPYEGARMAVPATFESGQEKRRKKRKEKRNKK